MTLTQKLKILNRLGLHLRAAARLVKTTSPFKCRILIKNGDRHANGKSIINLMTLAAGYGAELTLVFEGEDAMDAGKAIQSLFLDKFGEKE
ncbi:MAG TPA: HPr family phosphocarrier protein [bacterium]|nr:HPr family phosphocarrier protein [bacterium]